jgi:hypothetical protein
MQGANARRSTTKRMRSLTDTIDLKCISALVNRTTYIIA